MSNMPGTPPLTVPIGYASSALTTFGNDSRGRWSIECQRYSCMCEIVHFARQLTQISLGSASLTVVHWP